MPTFRAAPAGADAAAIVAARGTYELTFAADEDPDILSTQAPLIFVKGAGGVVVGAYGQFVSVLLESVLRIPETGGPGASHQLKSHHLTEVALTRYWVTVRIVWRRRSETQQLMLPTAASRGAFVQELRKIRAEATDAEREAWDILSADLELTAPDPSTPQPGAGSMTSWWAAAYVRGELADEEDGSLVAAGRAVLFAGAYLEFATGLTTGSHARAVEAAVESGAAASALRTGYTVETWALVVGPTRVAKQLDFLRAAVWEPELDAWATDGRALQVQMGDLFAYTAAGGDGDAAEAYVTQPRQLKGVLAHVPLLSTVVSKATAHGQRLSAVRLLVQAGTGERRVVVATLRATQLALQQVRVHVDCDTFRSLDSLEAQVSSAAARLRARRGGAGAAGSLPSALIGVGSGGGGASAEAADPVRSKLVAGYDAARLAELKDDAAYVRARTAVVNFCNARKLEDATLVITRGLEVAGSAAAGRSWEPPHKLLRDLLFSKPEAKSGGDKTYLIEPELEPHMAALRRYLPTFWGNRAAHALGEKLDQELPLPELAATMANTGQWASTPPDFFTLAYLPVMQAQGMEAGALYASAGHAPGEPVHQCYSACVLIADLVSGLMSDMGARHTRVADKDAAQLSGEIASVGDAYALARALHDSLGALPSTRQRMGELLDGLFGEYGIAEAGARASIDPRHATLTAFVVRPSTALQTYVRDRASLTKGRSSIRDLKAAGVDVSSLLRAPTPPPTPAPAPGAAGSSRSLTQDDVERMVAAGVKKALKRKSPEPAPAPAAAPAGAAVLRLRGGPAAAIAGAPAGAPADAPSELPPEEPLALTLDNGGAVAVVTGGRRGPAGSRYDVPPLAAKLGRICPVWYIAWRSGLEGDALQRCCGNAAHLAGSEEHPRTDGQSGRDLSRGLAAVKISEHRVNADGTAYERPDYGARGRGGPSRGAGGRRGGGGGGRAAAALALGAASGATGLVVPQTLAASAQLSTVLLAAAAATPALPFDSLYSAPTRERRALPGDAARALFVADGGCTLPEELGGGGLLAWLLRADLGGLNEPLDVVAYDHSGRLRAHLDELGGRLGTALSIGNRPSELPGLHFVGDAAQVLHSRRWRRAFVFAPCTDDALSGAQYFEAKVRDGRHFRGLKECVYAYTTPAEALMLEHPRTALTRYVSWPYQAVQPYWFGPNDDGLAEQKETWLFWRGWPDIQPTDLLPGPYTCCVARVRAASASDRDALKSRSHDGFMRAVAAHATVESIVPTEQPSFAAELAALVESYTRAHGARMLPPGYDSLENQSPAWVARSIRYEPSPDARVLADGGVRYEARNQTGPPSALRRARDRGGPGSSGEPAAASSPAAKRVRFADGAAPGRGPGEAGGDAERDEGEGDAEARRAATAQDAPGGDAPLAARNPQGGARAAHSRVTPPPPAATATPAAPDLVEAPAPQQLQPAAGADAPLDDAAVGALAQRGEARAAHSRVTPPNPAGSATPEAHGPPEAPPPPPPIEADEPCASAGDLALSAPPAQAVPPPAPPGAPVSCLRGTVWGNCFKGAGQRLTGRERDAVCDLHEELLERIRAGQRPGLQELASMASGRGVRVAGNTPANYSVELAAALHAHRGTQPNFSCAPACMRGARCHRSALLRTLALLGPAVGEGAGHAALTAGAVGVPTVGSGGAPPAGGTILVPLRVAGAAVVLVPADSACLFGEEDGEERPTRDAAVAAASAWAAQLLGSLTPQYAFLAGEWEAPGSCCRLVISVAGGPLRDDMRAAAIHGAATCTSCTAVPAEWRDAAALPRHELGDAARAALQRALAKTRAGPRADARLRIGRGDEAWVAASLEAEDGGRGAADAAVLGVEEVEAAHRDLRAHLQEVVARLRAEGDTARAEFMGGLMARVEPVPCSELPDGLVAPRLSDSDVAGLWMRPWRRDTRIHGTRPAPPGETVRPTTWPAGVAVPRCHADVLVPSVFRENVDFEVANATWHARRLAGQPATRPRGRAWGLDAARPEWRPFFAAGGILLFDERTGAPRVLTAESYPLRHQFEGPFARLELAGLRDREIVDVFEHGVCLKAHGLPFLQRAPNLLSMYESAGATGCYAVAAELRDFGRYDGGWHVRGPAPCAERGILGLATLPAVEFPMGAVLKRDGGTRLINDMTFGYGEPDREGGAGAGLLLEAVPAHEHPLPPAPPPPRIGAPRAQASSITRGGGGHGAIAVPLNYASGPYRPPRGESFTADGSAPWPREAKGSVAEEVTNDLIIAAPCRLARLPIFNLLVDKWKCFHQTNYRWHEIWAACASTPELVREGDQLVLSSALRSIANGRLSMGKGCASGICQREGNAEAWAILRRFDARQTARREREPEHPEIARWLRDRSALPADDYGTQARLATGSYYSDDPVFTVAGPPSRVEDLAHAIFEVLGPDGLGAKLAKHEKWLLAGWAAWQGVRFSAMLGVVWLPPDKALRADEDLVSFSNGTMLGADFEKMMGFLNYLGEVLCVHGNLNRLLWTAFDAHREECSEAGLGVGVTPVRPSGAARQPARHWRKLLMRAPGTTMLRVARRLPPPDVTPIEWALGSDACMASGREGDTDPPGMGGDLFGALWTYSFTASEIEVLTIPIAEFMAGAVGLMVLTQGGRLDYAARVSLEIDAYAVPRCALRDGPHAPGLLIAHDEFTRSDTFRRFRSRLTSRHVFGAGNEVADKASRARRAEAERLVRFLGMEPRWLALPDEAHAYIARVIERLRELRTTARPRQCDPAAPGGTAIRFRVRSPRVVAATSANASASSPAPPAPAQGSSPLAGGPGARSPRLGATTHCGHASAGGSARSPRVTAASRRSLTPAWPGAGADSPRKRSRPASPLVASPGCGAPLALSAGRGGTPQLTRTAARLHSPPLLALDTHTGRPGLASCSWAPEAAAPAYEPPRGAGASERMVQTQVDHLMAINASSSAPYALRGDPEVLRGLLSSSLHARTRASAENSVSAELGHLRLYWRPYCDLQRTPYIRPDVSQLTWDERRLEEAWWGGAIPWIQQRMPSQAGVVGAALPSSILKVLRNMRRMHRRQGITPVPLTSAIQATDGLLRDFVLEHGPLALVPKRKEPLQREEIADLLSFEGTLGSGRGSFYFSWEEPRFRSLRAMFHFLAQTGMRKGEVSLAPKVKFGREHMSFLNVRWRIGGVIYDALTPALFERLRREGGYALIRPGCSKSDQFSLHWGAATIYLRYDASEPVNAARELAREEMRRGVDPAKREAAPLFVSEGSAPWRHGELARIFEQLMIAIRGEERARQVSMHSWRIYLACALLAAGASTATIQCMLRWRSEDALRIYARINDFTYADWLTAAGQAGVTSVRTTSGGTAVAERLAAAPAPDPRSIADAMRDAAGEREAGAAEAGFQEAWRRAAALQVGEAVRAAHAEGPPEVDAYARIEALQGSMAALLVQAEAADAEDARERGVADGFFA